VLVPISVALHELGHAAAIWGFGGEVTGFGFYVFAGYVSYAEPFTDGQHILVALAGPLVNVALAAIALALVFGKRPPMRAAYNELLFQFAVISGANALIVYPLLDFATDLQGDWRQMYDGGVPLLSAAIFAGHAVILGSAFLAWRNPRLRQRVAELTGVPPGVERGLLGVHRPVADARSQGRPDAGTTPGEELVLRSAAARVASGWHVPIQGIVHRQQGGSQLTLRWTSKEAQRLIAVVASPSGPAQVVGAAGVGGSAPSRLVERWELYRWAKLPDEDELVLALRLAMELVERWEPAGDGAGAAVSESGHGAGRQRNTEQV
jgi:hypothetical protein